VVVESEAGGEGRLVVDIVNEKRSKSDIEALQVQAILYKEPSSLYDQLLTLMKRWGLVAFLYIL
jgi:hypothetical protein